MSVTKDLINELATKIYSNTAYPATKFNSITEIADFISSYMVVSDKLSRDANSNLFYKGAEDERNKFLGNPFIAGVYNMTYNGKPDYNLRDRIWVTISLIWSFAQKDARYLPIHQPYKFGSALVEAEKVSSGNAESESTKTKVSMFESIKKYIPFAVGGLVLAKIMRII
jgi:hypothetical protein